MTGRRRAKPDPTATYVAWQGFASDHPEPYTAVRRGDQLPGNHPIVRAHPQNFVRADADMPPLDACLAANSAESA